MQLTDFPDSCKHQGMECIFLKTFLKERRKRYYKVDEENLENLEFYNSDSSLYYYQCYNLIWLGQGLTSRPYMIQ